MPKRTQHVLKALAEQLRDGPLTSLILLQRRAEAFAAQQPSGDELIEALESLVNLTQCGMIQFHQCSAEFQRLVARLVSEQAEKSAHDSADHLRPN